MKMKIKNPAIPFDSFVAVIGANGYIAQETCHKLLEAGYRVRGTVRDVERNAWLNDILDSQFPGKFELVQVVDFEAEGAFDAAFKGAAGVIYVSVPVVFNPDPSIAVTPVVNGVLNTLSAAAKANVQRYVLSSSSKAVETIVYNTPHVLTTDTFNYTEIKKARDEPSVPTPERALTAYSAGRASAELAFWDWIRDNNPPFVASCVVPDGNFGRVLDAENTSSGPTTSVGMLMRALRGEREAVADYVGYYIDTQDTARLLVAALVLPSIASERIFAYYQHYTWNDLRSKVRELYPGREDLVRGEDYKNLGRDLGDADALIARSEEILREVGRPGFASLDSLLQDFVESFLVKQQ
ncbi:NAD(P)-binding protein [Aspergillus californicus]